MEAPAVIIRNHPQNESQQHLQRAVEIVGSRSELARQLGITRAALGHWFTRDKVVPANRCRDIQRLTRNKVTAKQMRPDVFGEPGAR
jgi:DNA-binding transcriptional regulator YdaS (Cro superfamily)